MNVMNKYRGYGTGQSQAIFLLKYDSANFGCYDFLYWSTWGCLLQIMETLLLKMCLS